MTGRDETRERLGDLLDRRGCDPTDEDRATADLAEAEGVSAATLGRAIDDAQKRPNVTRIAAYALRSARAWTAKHAQPLPAVDAHAMGHANGGKNASRRDRDDAFMTAITRRNPAGEVIDVDATEVSHVAERRGS